VLTVAVEIAVEVVVVVIIGLVLGSIAPILYGSLVEGGNVWLHHGVRAVLASGIMALWYLGWMRK